MKGTEASTGGVGAEAVATTCQEAPSLAVSLLDWLATGWGLASLLVALVVGFAMWLWACMKLDDRREAAAEQERRSW